MAAAGTCRDAFSWRREVFAKEEENSAGNRSWVWSILNPFVFHGKSSSAPSQEEEEEGGRESIGCGTAGWAGTGIVPPGDIPVSVKVDLAGFGNEGLVGVSGSGIGFVCFWDNAPSRWDQPFSPFLMGSAILSLPNGISPAMESTGKSSPVVKSELWGCFLPPWAVRAAVVSVLRLSLLLSELEALSQAPGGSCSSWSGEFEE